MGIRGKQGAQGMDPYSDWLLGLWNDENKNGGTTPWLYDFQGKYHYHYDELYNAFCEWWTNTHQNDFSNLTPEEQKIAAEQAWQQFLMWFNSGANTKFAFPIPDGVGVLLVLSLLCVLFTFLRSRDKKILEESNNQ
jgi:hypothetical protein